MTGWGQLEHLEGYTTGAGESASILVSLLICLMLELRDRLQTITPTHGFSTWFGVPYSMAAAGF